LYANIGSSTTQGQYATQSIIVSLFKVTCFVFSDLISFVMNFVFSIFIDLFL